MSWGPPRKRSLKSGPLVFKSFGPRRALKRVALIIRVRHYPDVGHFRASLLVFGYLDPKGLQALAKRLLLLSFHILRASDFDLYLGYCLHSSAVVHVYQALSILPLAAVNWREQYVVCRIIVFLTCRVPCVFLGLLFYLCGQTFARILHICSMLRGTQALPMMALRTCIPTWNSAVPRQGVPFGTLSVSPQMAVSTNCGGPFPCVPL